MAEVIKVSNDISGGDADARSLNSVASVNGRFVAFTSDASDLTPGDTNGHTDIFIKNMETGEIRRVELPAFDADVRVTGISADGLTVLFETGQSLVANDTNGGRDLYTYTNVFFELVSADDEGNAAGILSSGKESGMSAGARLVAFRDFATGGIRLYDAESNIMSEPVKGIGGAEPNGGFFGVDISDNGRFVVFTSTANNLVANDNNGQGDVFRLDTETDEIVLMSRATGGAQGNGFSGGAVVADDGTVAYLSQASNLTLNDGNGQGDAFVTQFKNGVFTTTVLSVDSNGDLFTSRNATTRLAISANGKVVAFEADADDDLHPEVSICRFDETDAWGLPTTYEGSGGCGVPDLSGSGNLCTFNSTSDDLGPLDGNGTGDVYGVIDGFGTEDADFLRLFDCSEYGTTLGESVNAGGGDDRVFGTVCDEIIRGGGGADTIKCRGGADVCAGGTGADVIDAGAGIDRVRGGSGNDLLFGGLDADSLWGDLGADRFSYRDIRESPGGAKIDRIFDFELGVDFINLKKIDADISTLADDAFEWIGNGTFSGTAGELRQVFAGKNTLVQGDVDGDGIKDISILVLRTNGQLIGDFSFDL